MPHILFFPVPDNICPTSEPLPKNGTIRTCAHNRLSTRLRAVAAAPGDTGLHLRHRWDTPEPEQECVSPRSRRATYNAMHNRTAMLPLTVLTTMSTLLFLLAHGTSAAVAPIPAAQLLPYPPMHWHSWNQFSGEGTVTDTNMRSIADALIETGMAAAGYDTVNVVCNGWGPVNSASHLFLFLKCLTSPPFQNAATIWIGDVFCSQHR